MTLASKTDQKAYNDSSQMQKEISPYRINDSSFFSNINNVSNIKYETNESNSDNIVNLIGDAVMNSEEHGNKVLQRVAGYKEQLHNEFAVNAKNKFTGTLNSNSTDNVVLKVSKINLYL